MKKLLVLTIAFFLFCSCAFAEEQSSPYPFGIHADASIDDVVEAMTPVFGEAKTIDGLDGLWSFEPDHRYLYDFLVDRASAICRESGWEIHIDLDEENQEFLIEHLVSLYAALYDWYGEPAETSPEYASYDLMGGKIVRVLYDEPEALQDHINKYKFENGWYDCIWPNCLYRLSIYHYQSVGGNKTGYSISLYWEKKDAETEEATPETAQ